MNYFMVQSLKAGIHSLVFLGFLTLFNACREKSSSGGPHLFEALNSKTTGLDFTNKLTPTQEFNVFKYMYYYNGGGVGAADFNNDGKIDVFFAASQVSNKL